MNTEYLIKIDEPRIQEACDAFFKWKDLNTYVKSLVSRGINMPDASSEPMGCYCLDLLWNKSTRDPSQEQLLDRTFKTSDGESAEQTRERMNKFLNKILKEYEEKRIAVISHGGSIKFFLLNWCTVNEDVKLVYNKNTILNIKSPCLLKFTFRKNELINLEQID